MTETQKLQTAPSAPPADVEVEYVPVTAEQMGLAAPAFEQFSHIFAKFTLPAPGEEGEDVEVLDEQEKARADKKSKKAADSATGEPKTKEELLQDFFAAEDSDEDMDDGDDGEDEQGEGGEDDGDEPKLAKRKLRKLRRMNIAQLKQMVQHPEAVEVHMRSFLCSIAFIYSFFNMIVGRRDRRRPGDAGPPEVLPKHRAHSRALVRQAQIPARKTRHRKTRVRTTGLHPGHGHHADAPGHRGEGGQHVHEAEDARQDAAQDGQD